MISNPVHKSCQPCPWGPNWPHLEGVISTIGLIWEKHEKIFSETTRPKACIFSMQQCLVVPYINPANHVPGVQIGYTPGASSAKKYFTYLRTYSNILMTCWLSGEQSLPFGLLVFNKFVQFHHCEMMLHFVFVSLFFV